MYLDRRERWIDSRGAGLLRLLATTSVVAASFVPGWVAAQTVGAPALSVSGSSPVPQVSESAYRIPAQSLGSALTTFGQQSGLQVSFDAALATGLRSTGFTGVADAGDALRHVLAGTGLSYRYTAARTVVIERTDVRLQPGVIALPPVNVQGQQNVETAYGPGVGYVAHLSAAGTKTGTPIIETPQSVSVITQDQIQQQGAETVRQALRYSSDVISEGRGASTPTLEQIYSRGFLADEYLDGLKLTGPGEFAQPQVDPYLLERIEILRGPSSVLYGQANPGGIINLVSKRPTIDPLHEVEIGGGSFGNIQGAFDLSGPLDQDGHFLYRLTGRAYTSNTQINHTKDQEGAIAPSFTWRPDDDTSLTFLSSYQNNPAGGFNGYVPAYGTVLPNPHGSVKSNFFSGDPDYDRFSRTEYNLGYLFEHKFNDVWTVRQNFRYSHIDSMQDAVWPSTISSDLQTLQRYTYNDEEHIDTIDLDNQAQAKFSTGPVQHTVLFGLDFQHDGFKQVGGFNFNAPSLNIFNPIYNQIIPPAGINYNTFQTLDQYGLYGQDQARFGHWAFLLGGRQDWAKTDVQDKLANTSENEPDKAFTWRAGLVYLFDNGLAPYASYSTSFEPLLGTTFSGTAFKPTTGEQYEVGIKYQPPGYNSFVTVSAYNTTEHNVETTDPNHANFSVQTGAIRARGFEIEGKASLTDGLSLTAAYAYLDSIVTSANDGTQGKRPSMTTIGTLPTNSASVWADYAFHSGSLKGLSLGTGVRYVGWTYGDPANDFKVPGFALVDASLQYDLEGFNPRLRGYEFDVNATNLFNHHYIASCATTSRCFFGLDQAIFAKLRYRW